jgi:multiple sugar transport system substrate-binding protein
MGKKGLASRGLTRRDFLKVSGAGLAGMSMLGASACGGGADDGGGRIEMWTRDDSAPLIRPAVEKFNSQNKDITIKLTEIPSDSLPDQFSTALTANEAPDIISIDLVLVPYFSSIGAFTDIKDRFESLDFKDKFNQTMVHLGEWKGAQNALPFSADVSALVYNKGHFQEAGLDPERPPVTWQELRESASALTTGGRYGYVYSGGEPGGHMFTFMPYVWGNGGEFLNENGTKALIDGPEAVEALRFFVELTRKYDVTPPGVVAYLGDEADIAFSSGRASMVTTGNFAIDVLNTEAPDLDFGVTLIPKNEGKQHSSFSGGELIAIPADSEYEEEAWEFIQFALSEEIQIDAWAKNGTIPVRSDFFDNEYFQKEPKYKVFAEALTVAECPYTTKYNELYNPLLVAMQNALRGKQSPEEAFSQAAARMNEILESG